VWQEGGESNAVEREVWIWRLGGGWKRQRRVEKSAMDSRDGKTAVIGS
jgi:hypothetical protein